MLDEAERRYPDIEWVRGDLREVPLAGAFDLVVSMYNSLQHIDLSGLERSFAAIRRITTAGGRFAFDIYKPNLAYLRIPQTNRLARSLQTPDGQPLEIREDTTFNEAEMCLSLAWRLVSPDRPDDRPLAETAMRIWQHQPQDVERLLASVGFCIVERFGDLDLQPYGDNAKKQVTICRAE
jgi:SAM-dependent methyltransferase